MSATECMKTVLASHFDIFLWGVLVGGVVVVLANFLNRFMEVQFMVDKKKMDVALGEYLVHLKKQINEPYLIKKMQDLMEDDGEKMEDDGEKQ